MNRAAVRDHRRRRCGRLLLLGLSLIALSARAEPKVETPRNFLFLGSGELQAHSALLQRPDIAGAQVVYNWKELEPEKDRYDFSGVERDLAIAKADGKALFLQIQDRFFEAHARNVPDYLLTEPEFAGGLARQFDRPGEDRPVATGWVAQQWNPAVRHRHQALLSALAQRFDGRVFGVNLPETAADIPQDSPPPGFSCDAYVDAELETLAHARQVFKVSHVVQYANFWPCEWNNDRGYMARTFRLADQIGAGLGGPDIVPWRREQMKNAYPFFHQYKGRLKLVAMAVQEPTLTYRNPETGLPFTRDEIVAFARDYLGVDVIFWTPEAAWLRRRAEGPRERSSSADGLS